LTLPAVHLANIEYPREFLDAVIGFLKEGGCHAEDSNVS